MKHITTKWILWGLMMLPLIPTYIQTAKAIDPYDKGLELTATWMVVCLAIAMLAGPFGRLFRQPQAFIAKQPIGLAAFTWLIAHILCYFYYHQSRFFDALADVILKPSVIMGAIAAILLAKLAFTSFKRAVKFLGKRWNVLHSFVVIAGTLGAAHGLSFQKTTSTDGAVISFVLLIVVLTRYYIQLIRTKR